MSVTVRLGEPDDWDAAVEVWRLADDARRGGVPSPDPDGRRVLASLKISDVFTIVAEDGDDGLVGFVLGLQAREDDGAGPPIPGVLHISMLFVHPARWEQGIGEAVMDRLLDEAWAREYGHAQLWTQATNERARRFYEHRGWTRSGREKPDDEGALIWHYERAL